jgi:hypothetical protein
MNVYREQVCLNGIRGSKKGESRYKTMNTCNIPHVTGIAFPFGTWMCTLLRCCAILSRYRPCDGPIPREGSPTNSSLRFIVSERRKNSGTFIKPTKYIVTHMIPARQRLGKHCLDAGIIAESKVSLLGNDTFPRQRILTKTLPWQRENNRGELNVRHGDLYSVLSRL